MACAGSVEAAVRSSPLGWAVAVFPAPVFPMLHFYESLTERLCRAGDRRCAGRWKIITRGDGKSGSRTFFSESKARIFCPADSFGRKLRKKGVAAVFFCRNAPGYCKYTSENSGIQIRINIRLYSVCAFRLLFQRVRYHFPSSPFWNFRRSVSVSPLP